MIISTGMASIAELDETVRAARGSGCRDLILLKCTSTYPAEPKDTNILTIPHMRELFQCQVGLSDHTMGIGVALASIALGATVIEKHFTLQRSDGGVDSAFSLEPEELQQLTKESERALQSLGSVCYGSAVLIIISATGTDYRDSESVPSRCKQCRLGLASHRLPRHPPRERHQAAAHLTTDKSRRQLKIV